MTNLHHDFIVNDNYHYTESNDYYSIYDDTNDMTIEAVLYREVWYQYGDSGIITPAWDDDIGRF